jgi:hypothetical protein
MFEVCRIAQDSRWGETGASTVLDQITSLPGAGWTANFPISGQRRVSGAPSAGSGAAGTPGPMRTRSAKSNVRAQVLSGCEAPRPVPPPPGVALAQRPDTPEVVLTALVSDQRATTALRKVLARETTHGRPRTGRSARGCRPTVASASGEPPPASGRREGERPGTSRLWKVLGSKRFNSSWVAISNRQHCLGCWSSVEQLGQYQQRLAPNPLAVVGDQYARPLAKLAP